jgi:hypothetical protein
VNFVDRFEEYVQKFRDTFHLDEEHSEIKFIPGNGDVGYVPSFIMKRAWNVRISRCLSLDSYRLGSVNQFARHVTERYASHFGHPNEQLHFANHSLVLLDAPGLVNEDYQRAGRGTSFDDWKPLKGGAIEFVKGIATRELHSIRYRSVRLQQVVSHFWTIKSLLGILPYYLPTFHCIVPSRGTVAHCVSAEDIFIEELGKDGRVCSANRHLHSSSKR